MPHVRFSPTQPTAETYTTWHTAKSATEINHLCFCNTGSAADFVRLYLLPHGEARAAKHALFYDLRLNPGDTVWQDSDEGFVMDRRDSLVIYSKRGTVSFLGAGFIHEH